MKTLINALLIGSLMTTVAFAGDPAPKAEKTAPIKKDAPATDAKATDKAAPATDAKTTDKAPAPKTAPKAKKDVKAPAAK